MPVPPSRSLTARVLIGVALPMVLLALALGIGGTLMIRNTVDAVNDRILDAAARGIADSLSLEDGRVTLDLSPTLFGMLENTARDNVYYSVRRGGAFLTGYPDLPQIGASSREDAARFVDARFLGRPVRIVARVRRLPGIAEPLVVEVAETLGARASEAHRLLGALVVLEITLIALAVLLLPLAVRWGLRPVARVRAQLDRRAASDLSPLASDAVPRELRDLVLSFNALMGRVAGVVAAMRRFTGDASHQMRTPLSIIRTHVAVLRHARPGGDQACQSIEDIDAGSIRLAHLIAQLLALARADNAAQIEPRRIAVDLGALAATVVADHADAAAAAGVALSVVLPVTPSARPRLVETEPSLAAELIGNLVDNAIRHGAAGGVVRVLVEDDGLLVVEDTGIGIPPAERDRMFERFARMAPYGSRGGSGLGLSIARALAEAIAARLTLHDGPGGRGLRAAVRFPPG